MTTKISAFASGTQFALIGHLSDPSRLDHYSRLEMFSNEFIKLLGSWCNTAYKWPRDPIHWWSRIWEYPFVSCLAERFVNAGSRVLDVGSATTFFPFYLAHALDSEIYALDADPQHNSYFLACTRVARQELKLHSPIPVPVQAPAECTAFKDNFFDLAYSVSVLEHVPDPGLVIKEIFRILKPGGYMILTLDVAHSPDVESEGLQVPDLIGISETVCNMFRALIPPLQPLPHGLLTFENSPNRDYSDPELPWRALLRPLRSAPGNIRGRLHQVISRKHKKSDTSQLWNPHLCILGLVAQKPI